MSDRPGQPQSAVAAASSQSSRNAPSVEELTVQLVRANSEIATLSQELEETNQGVIALYAELDDRALELRQASELKSRFLSYMSHEFRVPLGAIRSITRILLDRLDGPLTSEQEIQIKFVQSSSIELTEMVDDLLDLARIEAGRITISPAWFDMVDLFSALRGMFKPILTSDVSLIFDEPVEPPRLYTDDKKLSQILRNFISNALKFTVKGEVRVSVARSDPGWVIFTVTDTGIGIAPEHLDKLFQDFIQVDSPIQKRKRGAGLGLALSRKFADLLGGQVIAKSQVGVGSQFSVLIPLHPPVVPPAETTPNSVSGGGA